MFPVTLHYTDDRVSLYHGDCIEVMRSLPDSSVDAIVTDPPYGLEFMGKEWDAPWKAAGKVEWADEGTDKSHPFRDGSVRVEYGIGGKASVGFQDWFTVVATEALRVLKPGGHLLAFGGTRTWHRLAVAIEDAGFEVRDSIAWQYGSGFPKSLDVQKAIAKTAGAEAAQQWQGWGTALKPAFEPIVVARKPLIGTVAANVLTHGTGALNIDGCRIGTDETLGRARGGWGNAAVGADNYGNFNSIGVTKEGGRWPANVILDESQAAVLDAQSGDTSRFFYCPKANKKERPNVDGVAHPTVKPMALMQYLVRLVTPPGGTILEPFAGSGTTIEAALNEGFNVIGIEMTDEYLPLIMARIERFGDKLC